MARAAVLGLSLCALLAVAIFWQAPPPRAPRDRIAPADAPATGPITALAFGTSLTARARWPSEAGQALAACGLDTEVAVLARPGDGSADAMAQLDRDRSGRSRLAFVEFAINDADLIDGVSQAKSLANHRAFLAAIRVRHPGIAIVLVTTNPVAGLQRLKRPKLMAYDDLYLRLAEETGASLFDGTARWGALADAAAALPGGLHPDPAVEAGLYVRPLTAIVAAALGRDCGT